MDRGTNSSGSDPFSCKLPLKPRELERRPRNPYYFAPAPQLNIHEQEGSEARVALIINSSTEIRVPLLNLIRSSKFFEAQVKAASTRGPAGVYEQEVRIYISADLTPFVHVLNFITDGIFPYLWRGFNYDHALQRAVEQRSRDFGVLELHKWLIEKSFDTIAWTFENPEHTQPFQLAINNKDNKDQYLCVPAPRVVYRCPLRGETLLNTNDMYVPRLNTNMAARTSEGPLVWQQARGNWSPWGTMSDSAKAMVAAESWGMQKYFELPQRPAQQPPVTNNRMDTIAENVFDTTFGA